MAAIIDESKVQELRASLEQVAWKYLGWLPDDFEFHGNEIWQGSGYWKGMPPSRLLEVYEDVIDILDVRDVDIGHSSIDKARLTARYDGHTDENAYRLALQFLLEKVDGLGSSRKVLVADESKEQELRAIKMVSDLQKWGAGEVPGRPLSTIIDSLHFVSSRASPGVQMADVVAYALQRARRREPHRDARKALRRIATKISDHTRTWRDPWPAR